MPLVMGTALSQHNNVMRKAAWVHYGFIIGQEGDAFILAFREPLDAVAFCLQAQQALRKVEWPQELLHYQQHQDAGSSGSAQPVQGEADADASNDGSGGGWAAGDAPPSRARSSSGSGPPAAERTGSGSSTSGNKLWQARPGSIIQSGISHLLPAVQLLCATNGGDPTRECCRVAQCTHCSVRQQTSAQHFSLCAAADMHALRPCTCAGSSSSIIRLGLPPVRKSIDGGALGVGGRSSLGGPADQQQSSVSPISVLVPGLRVRMGVASGTLGEREDCLSCRVLEIARGELQRCMDGTACVVRCTPQLLRCTRMSPPWAAQT